MVRSIASREPRDDEGDGSTTNAETAHESSEGFARDADECGRFRRAVLAVESADTGDELGRGDGLGLVSRLRHAAWWIAVPKLKMKRQLSSLSPDSGRYLSR